MPKIKSKGSAKKRFKLSGTGKIRRRHAYNSHLFANKSKRQKRDLNRWATVEPADVKNIKRALGLS